MIQSYFCLLVNLTPLGPEVTRSVDDLERKRLDLHLMKKNFHFKQISLDFSTESEHRLVFTH